MKILEKIKSMSFKQRVIGIGVFAFVLIASATLILSLSFSANGVNTFYGYELKSTEVENLSISSINVKEENGITKYEASVQAKEAGMVSYINIIFKDEEGKEIVRLVGYIGTSLTKGETKQIEASTDADLSKIKSIEYEVIK